MQSKKIYIMSLKFAPGLLKEYFLLGGLFEENNIKVSYIVSKKYKPFFSSAANVLYPCSGNTKAEMFFEVLALPFILLKIIGFIAGKVKNSFFLFYNPHPLNLIFIIILGKVFRGKTILFLHEPDKKFKELLLYGYGGFLYYSLVMGLQKICIKYSDKVVTMSPYGSKIFKEKYPKKTANQLEANLLLKGSPVSKINNRSFFSFIGTVNHGKGIDDIINCINFLIDEGNKEIQFKIITSSNIERNLNKLKPGWDKYLVVINEAVITDEMISEVILQSCAVLILHLTASQSGVLPLALSHQTPVIVRSLEAFTQYIDDENLKLPFDFKSEELIVKCLEVKGNQEFYSNLAKDIFDENFSENKFLSFYGTLVDEIK